MTIELDRTVVERGWCWIRGRRGGRAGSPGGPVDAAWLRELVEAGWSRPDEARVRTFLPMLVRPVVVDQMLGA